MFSRGGNPNALEKRSYPFFISHLMDMEVRVEINRLEIPVYHHTDTKPSESIQNNEADSIKGNQNRRREKIETLKQYNDSEIDFENLQKDELTISAYLTSNNLQYHFVNITTRKLSKFDENRNCIIWDDILSFPVKIQDLRIGSRIVFYVWGITKNIPIGMTSISLFDHISNYMAKPTGESSFDDIKNITFDNIRKKANQKIETKESSDMSKDDSGIDIDEEHENKNHIHEHHHYTLLRQGKQKLYFHFLNKRRLENDIEVEQYEKDLNILRNYCGEIYFDHYFEHDYRFLIEKLKEEFNYKMPQNLSNGVSPPNSQKSSMNWLNKFTNNYLDQCLSELEDPSSLWSLPYTSVEERLVTQNPYLIVTFPIFKFPVLFEEKIELGKTSGLGPNLPLLDCNIHDFYKYNISTKGGKQIPSILSSENQEELKSENNGENEVSSESNTVDVDGSGGPSNYDEYKEMFQYYTYPGTKNDLRTCQIDDCEADAIFLDNPVEEKYRMMTEDKERGIPDPNAKPNQQEKKIIDTIINSMDDHLKPREATLLWNFSYSLTDNPKALTKVILAVQWDMQQEVDHMKTLLQQWTEKTNIDVSDALKLLGRGKENVSNSSDNLSKLKKANYDAIVRSYAVQVLSKRSVEELIIYILQLVQALRYDTTALETIKEMKESRIILGDGVLGAIESNTTNINSYTLSFKWKDKLIEAGRTIPKILERSNLAAFLVDKGSNSIQFATFLFWFLKVETKNISLHGQLYYLVLEAFMFVLQYTAPIVHQLVKTQEDYMSKIAVAQNKGRETKGRKDKKEEVMKTILRSKEYQQIQGASFIPLPLKPKIFITGCVADSAFMFKSSMYPAVIEFKTVPIDSKKILSPNMTHEENEISIEKEFSENTGTNKENKTLPDTSSSKVKSEMEEDKNSNTIPGTGRNDSVSSTDSSVSDSSGTAVSKNYKVVVKSGDDLRQDQLVIQMIVLLDHLLKQINLDLNLTPYGVLATGAADGLMEFVQGSLPVSDILKNFGNIETYLKKGGTTETGEVPPERMYRYVRSCAGYCVITYILGIGDRHLDNIMMLEDGRLFHIDFGFILGADPKPYPPPFRFTTEMKEAMGEQYYVLFEQYCCQAFTCFRENAKLILNLLSLMVDAGLKDLSGDTDAILKKVEEKLRLELPTELAEKFFIGLIQTSLNSLAPKVLEKFHQIAVSFR